MPGGHTRMDPAPLTPRAGPQQPHCRPLGAPVCPGTAQPHTGQPGARTTVAARYSQRSTPVSSRELGRGENLEENRSQRSSALPQAPWNMAGPVVMAAPPQWRDGGAAQSPQHLDQRGFHAPKPALKQLQHLPGCVSTAKGNPHLELTHNLAFEAFCSNKGSPTPAVLWD